MERGAAVLISMVLVTACAADGRTPAANPPASPFPSPTVDAAAVPDVVELVCDAHGSRLETHRVRPQPDGVHVIVDNQLDHDPGISFRLPGGGGGGRNLKLGRQERVFESAPGTMQIACNPEDFDFEKAFQDLAVVDPDELYVDGRLDCVTSVTQIEDFVEEPPGDSDPERVARDRLDFGLREGDELIRAGYPESKTLTYVVEREGYVVASTDLHRARRGWYSDGYSACDSFAN